MKKEVNGNVALPEELLSQEERDLLLRQWDELAAIAANADPQTQAGRKARDWAIVNINPIRQKLGL